MSVYIQVWVILQVLPASDRAFAAMQEAYDTISAVVRQAKHDAKQIINAQGTQQAYLLYYLYV